MTVIETTERTDLNGRWLWIPSRYAKIAQALSVAMTALSAGVILAICGNDSGAPTIVKAALIAAVLGFHAAGSTLAPKTPQPGRSVDIYPADD